jgi:hypothetical protein
MNCVNLNQAYTEAKASTPQGDALSATNRYTLILPSGYYNCADTFRVDSQYVDIVSLTGNRDIIFNGATIKVTGNDVFIRGIDVGTKQFFIESNLNNLKLENCKGGLNSYAFNGTISGNLNNCVGGGNSFAYGGTISGTVTNCTADGNSFANSGTISGTVKNCYGGTSSFARFGTISGIVENCSGGNFSFNPCTITGSLAYNVIRSGGSFATPTTGTNVHYRNGNGTTDNAVNTDNQNLGYTNSTGALTITGGTGVTIPTATATVRGLVPDPPNDANYYLAGDGTFDEFRENIIVLDSSYITNSTTYENIGKLSMNLGTGFYNIQFKYVYNSNTAVIGCSFSFATGTITLGDQTYYSLAPNGITSSRTYYTTNPDNITNTTNTNNNPSSGITEAFIEVTGAGTFIPTFKAETGGVNSCTLKANLSYIKITKL